MKIFCSLLTLFFLIAKSSAQESPANIFHLDTLISQGILLNKNWTFHPGDNHDYASYNYDGKNGIPVNPALQLDQLPVVKRSGIGWFRLKLQVDSSLRNKAVGITLSLFGAAEIYLNGELVYKFGNVSLNYDDEKTQAIYARALNLSFGNNENQILSVRYSNHPRNFYLKTGIIPDCLRIVMFSPNDNISYYGTLMKKYYLFIGISLIIGLSAATLTLFFFFSFRYRKEYLYYGLFFTFQFLGSVLLSTLVIGKSVDFSVNESLIIQYVANVLYIVDCLFYLNGVYALFHLKKSKFYWCIFWFAIIGIVAIIFLPPWGGTWFIALVYPLAYVEMLSVYYTAIKKRFRGAWILFLSILISLLAMVILIKFVFENDSEKVALSVTINILLPALGLIVFLARDFANISLSLQSKLTQVQELSEKSLAQEKEKQEILASQKDKLEMEVQERTAELSKSLANLKATQSQLIQSEKMASLGELTAGIAHEIQNPLNFVNNFSDVNKELISELKAEIKKGNIEEVNAIAGDIEANEEKINHHGKRADAIVKNMLQHSRKSTGQRELTDINTLADEYIRLAYHGMRAKDKSFNVTIETDFDKSIGTVNIIPQDIGRVILNLVNNAFYAASLPSEGGFSESESNRVPSVSVSTKKEGTKVLISVRDNGPGIPKEILDKIFQPFFTTKPTGQGTGLGLSLSYDIVKAHGGEINVHVEEGKETQFVVLVPF